MTLLRLNAAADGVLFNQFKKFKVFTVQGICINVNCFIKLVPICKKIQDIK